MTDFDEELFKAAEHAVIEEALIADHAPLVGAVLEAVEPLIRADERVNLRAQVQALRDRPISSFDGYTGQQALDEVLALPILGSDDD